MNPLMKYPAPEAGSLSEIEPAGIKQRLERAKAHHERELAKVNAALDALDNQPKVADLLELVMKAL
jgi:hypothetical protein